MDFAGKVNAMLGRLDDSVAGYAWLDALAARLKVSRRVLVIAGAFVFAAVLFFGFGAGFVCNLVGFAYPAYASFKAIESKNKDDDTKWLTYWVVFAMFTLVETFINVILHWVPFYYAIKLGFLVWMFLPSTRGAEFIYEHFLQDLLKNAQKAAKARSSSNAGAGAGAAAPSAPSAADSAKPKQT